MFFIVLGAVSAAELNNVTSTGSSDLISDNDELSLSNFEDSNENLILKNSQGGDDTLKEATTDAKQTSSENGTTNTTKVSTKLEVNNAHYSKTATVVKVVLKDKNGTALANQSVSLKLNSKTYKATTNNNGIAYFNTNSLKKGTYSVTAKYNGNSQYIKSSISKKIKVLTSISGKDMTIAYGENKNYTAKFYRDNGNLKNGNVKITLNGKTYTVKTDSNGVAQIDVSTLLPGTYKVKLYNSYSKETVTKTITVKKASSKITASNEYILPKTKSSYSVVLKNNNNKPIKNAKINFNYNNKKETVKTDGNGEATISIPALSKGTYTITYKYTGNSKYKSVSGSKKLYVKDSTVILNASDLKMQYNDGSSYELTVQRRSDGKVLANKTITFTFNGKTTNVITDMNGIAKLDIGNLKPNTYSLKATHSTPGAKDYTIHTGKVIISKQKISIIADNLVMKYNDGSSYQATLKNKTGANLNGVEVKFTFNGKSTKVTTDANGIAKFAVTEKIGEYPVDIEISNSYYTSAKVTKSILVNGTTFTANDITVPASSSSTFDVKVLDGQNKPVKTTIKFTLNNKAQSVQTDANGIAKLGISGLAKGKYTVTYTDGSTTGSSLITVADKVTLAEVIKASQNVKKYIEGNGELPGTVTIGSVTYSLADYLYIASQAIINLNDNSKKDIEVKHVNDPAKPQAAANLGELYDYLSVAKSVVNTCNANGIMPNSVSSKVGTIGYNGLVYATARVVAFYEDYSIMPNYVSIKTYATSTSSSLNSKNTITDLTKYLKASTHCQVGNSAIKAIVNKVTDGLTTDLAKAKAIYNYVRDYVSYSFYYDTRYGAVGTLNAKTGNCVDQAHLLIAMYRTAGLAARYVHGTCVFSSGSTYGHVWTQVLIGDTWIVTDATSARNSFGSVVNWNNYNYHLKGYYSGIEF